VAAEILPQVPPLNPLEKFTLWKKCEINLMASFFDNIQQFDQMYGSNG
jgi:hypothetical protein